MLITNEIASITILLPYQKGDKTIHQIIPFKVFREQQHYKAIPLISVDEKNSAGLSGELSFCFKNNRVVADAEPTEANLNAINNIASELRILRIV